MTLQISKQEMNCEQEFLIVRFWVMNLCQWYFLNNMHVKEFVMLKVTKSLWHAMPASTKHNDKQIDHDYCTLHVNTWCMLITVCTLKYIWENKGKKTTNKDIVCVHIYRHIYLHVIYVICIYCHCILSTSCMINRERLHVCRCTIKLEAKFYPWYLVYA